MPKVDKESFSAWINKMPIGNEKLIVQGEAEVPTGGWHATLTSAQSPGINEHIIILDLTFTPPSDPATQVISKITCRYEESPPKKKYTEATIRYDGDEFTIPVGEAQ